MSPCYFWYVLVDAQGSLHHPHFSFAVPIVAAINLLTQSPDSWNPINPPLTGNDDREVHCPTPEVYNMWVTNLNKQLSNTTTPRNLFGPNGPAGLNFNPPVPMENDAQQLLSTLSQFNCHLGTVQFSSGIDNMFSSDGKTALDWAAVLVDTPRISAVDTLSNVGTSPRLVSPSPIDPSTHSIARPPNPRILRLPSQRTRHDSASSTTMSCPLSFFLSSATHQYQGPPAPTVELLMSNLYDCEEAKKKDIVFKHGAKTGTTLGHNSTPRVASRIETRDGRSYHSTYRTALSALRLKPRFSWEGDSGALIYGPCGEKVGMLVAGVRGETTGIRYDSVKGEYEVDPLGPIQLSSLTLYTPIEEVMRSIKARVAQLVPGEHKIELV